MKVRQITRRNFLGTTAQLAAVSAFAPPTMAKVMQRLRKIGVKTFQDKMYAFWLGQCVGNIYGLPHENKYVDAPGPDEFPYGYRETARMREANGAFSDDDTDIEYIYLCVMEQHGPEPTYGQIAAAWRAHIRGKVWIANRAALAAMGHGFTPPITGMKPTNPHWFQIDPQLVNEIWAVTAPGMVRYAAEKSDWAARVMADDWGVEPTVHYGAMFSAAFFESDVERLIDIGLAALPADGRFAGVVRHMQQLHQSHPGDWKTARAAMAKAYHTDEPLPTKTIWNALLNGACGILALLYGQGDFQKTLDLSCAMGMDADNQAATMCGLIAVAKGSAAIPPALLFPFPHLGWKLPFNDVYRNVSRADMPDAKLTELAARTAALAEQIILKQGGRRVVEGGEEFYLIETDGGFDAPLELPVGPLPAIVAGSAADYEVPVSGGKGRVDWRIAAGTLPSGLSFSRGRLRGTAAAPGVSTISIEARKGRASARRDLLIIVRGRNLAPDAERILAISPLIDPAITEKPYVGLPPELLTSRIDVIRDGRVDGNGSAFYSLTAATTPRDHFYGYEWKEPQRLGLIAFHTGAMDWDTGWFSALRVEYRDEGGFWREVAYLRSYPQFPVGDVAEAYDRPHFAEYLFAFAPVETRSIRIIGGAGRQFEAQITSITELAVYPPVPGIEAVLPGKGLARGSAT